MNEPSDAASEHAAQPGHTGQSAGPDVAADGDPPDTPVSTAPASPTAPILPAQSREDTDVGWGDYADRDDNDRLMRDRPPHWDNA